MQSVMNNDLAGDLAHDVSAHFKCPVCMELFNTTNRIPKGLPCQHNFCERCMNAYMATNMSFVIACPLCKQEFVKPVNGARGLPTNLIIRDIIEVTSNNDNESNEVKSRNVVRVVNRSINMQDAIERSPGGLWFSWENIRQVARRRNDIGRPAQFAINRDDWGEWTIDNIGDVISAFMVASLVIIGKGVYHHGVFGFIYSSISFVVYAMHFLGDGFITGIHGLMVFLFNCIYYSIASVCCGIYCIVQTLIYCVYYTIVIGVLGFVCFYLLAPHFRLGSTDSVKAQNDENNNDEIEDDCDEQFIIDV